MEKYIPVTINKAKVTILIANRMDFKANGPVLFEDNISICFVR